MPLPQDIRPVFQDIQDTLVRSDARTQEAAQAFLRAAAANAQEMPQAEHVTLYSPGRRSTTLYWPDESVVTVRVFSINDGLAASTVTPGRTAPDVSLTTPAIELWACAAVGSSRKRALATKASNELRRILYSFSCKLTGLERRSV